MLLMVVVLKSVEFIRRVKVYSRGEDEHAERPYIIKFDNDVTNEESSCLI